MDSGRSTRALPRVGFPIRKSPDQRMVSSFPGLIAAAHVLRRLLAPRHPPCALSLLTRKNTFTAAMEFSRCAWDDAHEKTRPERTVSQNSTACTPRSTFVLGEPGDRTASRAIDRRTPPEYKSSGIPRKEVIQPQLPLRLPCYDFTPIINPTFDGCLLRRG